VGLRVEDGKDDSRDAGARLDTVSDKDGRFSFRMVPGGTYRVRVRREGFAPAAVSGIKVSYGGAAVPVEVRLSKGVIVSGTVVLPPDLAEEPRFMYLSFRDEDNKGIRTGDRVNLDTMAYAVDGLAPGKYKVEMYASRRGGKFEPLIVDVPRGGTDGLVLQFRVLSEDGGKDQ